MFLFDKKPTKKSLYQELLPTVPLFQFFFLIFLPKQMPVSML